MRASITGQAFRRFDNDPTSTTDPTVRDLTFTNPQSLHKIWRHGTLQTGTIQVPYGYSKPTWQIIQHDSGNVIVTGSGTSVSWTPSFLGTDKCNTYDLLVTTVRSGYPRVTRVFPGEITVLPVTFTEGTADEVWNMATGGTMFKDGGWTDHAATGWKIWVKNSNAGTAKLGLFYYRSTNPLKPIHIIFDGATINNNGSNTSFSPGSSQNIIFDGCNNNAVQYGLKLNRAIGIVGVTENLYITPADATHESYNWIMCGIHVDNGVYTQGGTGCAVQMTNNAAFNANTYTFDRFTMFNMLMENTSNEAYYTGHTRDTDFPPFARLSNCLYYRCNANNSRNESWQHGGHTNSDVFSCSWQNSGLANESGQMNNWQFAKGNKDVYIYMNRGQTAHDLTQQFVGISGKNTEVFSNIFETTAGPGYQNWLVQYSQSTTYSELTYSVYNNLEIALTNATEMYSLYKDPGNPPTSTIMKFYADGNVYISTNTTQTVSYNGFDLGNTIMNNKIYNTTQLDDLLCFDAAGKNYKIATLDSPLLGFSRNSTALSVRTHRYSNFDYEGYMYNPANLAAGPYSGIQLMNGPTLIKNIGSVASQSDVTIPNGTSFATAQSTYLPTKVRVTYADGSNRMVSVTWIQGTYNGSVAGTYALNGTINLPADSSNNSSLQAHVNAIVQAPLAPVSIKVNFFTGTATGWNATGATSPVSAGTVDYGQIGTSGIGIRALNSTNKLWGGTGASGGTGATYPNAVHQTYWFSQATSGADFELYEVTAGSLTGRLFTIKILGSRASITGPRTSQYTAASGQTGSVNVGSPTGNDTLVTLSHVAVISTVIRITVKGISPNDASPASAHINGMEVDSE